MTRQATIALSLASYDTPAPSLKSLALVSRSSAWATKHRLFRVLRPVSTSDVAVEGTLVYTLLSSRGWEHALDVRSITISISKIPLTDAHSRPEDIAASILSALPHLQHVKLTYDPSYIPRSFLPIVQALAHLSRLESLDITDFHACVLNASSPSSSSSSLDETWAQVGAKLRALRLTLNKFDRVENRRSPIFRTLIAHATSLRALDLTGSQAPRDVVELLAGLAHPERMRDLRISLCDVQATSGAEGVLGAPLVGALNRLEGLEELSIGVKAGFESVFFQNRLVSFDRSVASEPLSKANLSLPNLHHLHLNCSEAILTSLGLGCEASCACPACVSSSASGGGSAGGGGGNAYLRWSCRDGGESAALLPNPFIPFGVGAGCASRTALGP